MINIRLVVLLLFFSFSTNVYATLIPNFTSDRSAGCVTSSSHFLVHFSDATTGGAISRYHWVFDNLSVGDTDNVANPYFSYSTPGHYDVKLIVYDALGNADSITMPNYITVTAPHVIRFTASDTVISCVPQTIVFTNNSDTTIGCTSNYTWNIDTGTSTAVINTIGLASVSITYNRLIHIPDSLTVSLVETDGCGCSNSLTKTGYIHMDSLPTANFYAVDTTPCGAPRTVCFTNTSTTAVSFLWHFGDGTSSTAFNPCHTYTTSGNYSDTLIASAGTCTSRLIRTNYIRVGNFVGNFYTTTSSGIITNTFCVGTPFTYIDNSTPTSGATRPTYRHFRFSSVINDTSIYSSGTHIYNTPGVYRIYDSIRNALGCSDTVSHIVIIDTLPAVSISATHAYRCSINDTVHFTSTIFDTASIQSKIWHFGENAHGYLSAINTAHSDSVHIYDTLGYFTPSIQVTDIHGCTSKDSIVNFININLPKDSIVLKNSAGVITDSGCFPLALNYYSYLNPNVTFYTDSFAFGDGTSSDISMADSGVHTYTYAGRFKLIHYYHLDTAFGGCYLSDTTIVPVGDHPIYAINALPDSLCPNDSIMFIANCSTCTSELWNVAGSPIRKDTDKVGFYIPGWERNYFLGNYNGCFTDTLRDSIFIYFPSANFTDSIIAANCISYSINPTAYLTHKFTNTSVGDTTVGVPNVHHFKWNFGDALSASNLDSTHRTVSHTFSGPGTYTVTLTDSGYYSTHACSNIKKIAVYVYPIDPTVDTFTASKTVACRNSPIKFTGPIAHYGGFYNNYKWKFKDGGTYSILSSATTDTMLKSFTNLGSDTVKLIITNKYGCIDSITNPNYITITAPGYTNGLRDTGFTVDIRKGCSPLLIHLHDNDTARAGGSIVSRKWAWNTGGIQYTSIGRDTSYLYYDTISTLHNVIRIATDDLGCVDMDTIQIKTQKPLAHFYSNDTLACTFVKVGFHSTTPLSTYTWNFGDGTTGINSIGQDTTHIYTVNGIYTVNVIVVSLPGSSDSVGVGCIDTSTVPVIINVGNSSIRDSFTLSANFRACPPLTINTIHTSTAYTNIWKMGIDSSVFSIANHVTGYTYNFPGTYVVTLIDSIPLGCKDTMRQTLTIGGPTGILTFSPDTICAGKTVKLHLTPTGSVSLDPSFIWTVGTTTSTTVDSTVFTLGSSGIIHPNVQILHGTCPVMVYATDSIYVSASPTIHAVGDSVICRNATDSLSATGASTYVWSPAASLSCSTCLNPVATPTVNTIYKVVGTSGIGCKDSVYIRVNIDVPFRMALHQLDSMCFGQSDTVYVTTHGIMPLSYNWSPTDSFSCATCDTTVIHPLANEAYSYYSLSAKDSLNCLDTVSFKVWVHGPTGTLSIIRDSICQNQSVHFHLNPTSTYALDANYIWSRPPYSDTITTIPDLTFNYNDTGKYNPSVIITQNHCSETMHTTDSVLIFPTPTVTVNHPALICKQSSTVLTANLTRGTGTYSWLPVSDLSCNTCANPTASPTITTTYTVTAINSHGCIDTASTTVMVDVPSVIVLSGRNTICNGEHDTIIVVSGASGPYHWTGGTDLSCTTCITDTVIVHPTSLRTYILHAVDANSCNNSDSITVNVTPLAVLRSSLTPSAICDNTAFNYTPLSDSVGTVFAWNRVPVSGILPATNSGTGAISEILHNTTPFPDSVVYVYTMTYLGCKDSQNVKLRINPLPAATPITTKSYSTVCNNTMYQNFGTTVAKPANESYTWIGNNCTVWAVGSDKQYCLVNFIDSGEAVVILATSYTGVKCYSNDSVIVRASSNQAAPVSVIYDNGNLICLQNSVDTYQWGYDDKTTLDSTLIFNEINQNYYIPDLDTAHKYYWVMTTSGSCLQKTYLNQPTGINNVNAENSFDVKVYPNPANDYLIIETIGNTAGVLSFNIIDLSGKTLKSEILNGNKVSVGLKDLSNGMYLIEIYRDNIKTVTTKFLKSNIR